MELYYIYFLGTIFVVFLLVISFTFTFLNIAYKKSYPNINV